MMPKILHFVLLLSLLVALGCGGKKETKEVRKTPAEKVWAALVEVEQTHAKLLQENEEVDDLAQFTDALLKVLREKQELLIRLARYGEDAPPVGVPEEFNQQYLQAVEERENQDTAFKDRLGSRMTELTKLIDKKKAADPLLAKQPFRLKAEIRGAKSRVTIHLKKFDKLTQPQVDRLMKKLKRQTGADHAQLLVEDGEAKIVLAGVSNFIWIANSLELGPVSDIDEDAKSFTLEIDPQMLKAEDE